MKKIKSLIFIWMYGIHFLNGIIFTLIGSIMFIIAAVNQVDIKIIMLPQALVFFYIGILNIQLFQQEQILTCILIPVKGKEFFIAKIVFLIFWYILLFAILTLILFLVNFFKPVQDIRSLIYIALIFFPVTLGSASILSAIAVKGTFFRNIFTPLIGYILIPGVIFLIVFNYYDKLRFFWENGNKFLLLLFVYIIYATLIFVFCIIGIKNFEKFQFRPPLFRNKDL